MPKEKSKNEKATVLNAIEEIETEISKEMTNFLVRKGMKKELAETTVNEHTPLNHVSGFTLSDEDKARFQILFNLRAEIDAIHTTALTENLQAIGLVEKYQGQLKKAIEPAVLKPELTKQYSGLQKLGITLLNIVTSITVVPALIKKAATGSLLYSTQGKPKEAVKKAQKITEKLSPKKNKP